VAAYLQLRLARACVADLRLPWERRYTPGKLTPCRVRRAVLALLLTLGTPCTAAKTLRTLSGAPQRPPLGPGEALSGPQEERLSPPKTIPSNVLRWFAMDFYLVAKLLLV
jgi:hypothetical protein